MNIQHVLAPRPPSSPEQTEAGKMSFEQAAEEARVAAESMPPPPPQNMSTLRDHLLAAQAGYPRYTSPTPSFAPQWDPQMEGSGLGSASGDTNDDLMSLDGRRRMPRELSSTKRAAQNRAAQRAFRERKEQYIKQLEAKAKGSDDTRARCNELIQKITELQDLVKSYKTLLEDNGIEHQSPSTDLLESEQPLVPSSPTDAMMRRSSTSMAPPALPMPRAALPGSSYLPPANPYERVVDLNNHDRSACPPFETSRISPSHSAKESEQSYPSQHRRLPDLGTVMPSTESDPAPGRTVEDEHSSSSPRTGYGPYMRHFSRATQAIAEGQASTAIDPDLGSETQVKPGYKSRSGSESARPMKRRRSSQSDQKSPSPRHQANGVS